MSPRLRKLLKCFTANLLHYSGLLRLWRRLRNHPSTHTVCVLGFHRVLNDAQRNQSNSLDTIVLSEATFARLLEYLASHFQITSVEALCQPAPPRSNGSKPWCVLTFDDGWKDTYTTAYPWLKKFRAPATIFLVAGLIGAKESFWVEKLNRVWEKPTGRKQILEQLAGMLTDPAHAVLLDVIECLKHMSLEQRSKFLKPMLPHHEFPAEHGDQLMTWDDVLAMSREGIDFGGHSVTHPLLVYEDQGTVDRELLLCKQILEEKLGKPVGSFAYPNGTWDERVREAVQRAGYQCAFTTESGWYRWGENQYVIRRILLQEGNVTGFRGEFSPAMFQFTLSRSG